MDQKIKIPSLNSFFIEDPNEPGSMIIPVVIVNGEKVILHNIKKELLDFFRPMVAAIAKRIDTKAYFIEYEQPSIFEEIVPVDYENIEAIEIGKDGKSRTIDLLNHPTDLVDEIPVKRINQTKDNKSDEETLH